MMDELTPESVATEIKLLRDDAGYDGTILLVEGETDASFFKNFLIRKETLVRWLNGKDKTIRIVTILEEDNRFGFVAIVDADFWHIDGIPALGSNVIVTDAHDLDLMIFSSPAFEKVVTECFTAINLDKLQEKFGNLRWSLLESVRLLGYLRLLNERERLGISFRKPNNPHRYPYWLNHLDLNNLTLSLEQVLISLCGNNRNLKNHLSAIINSDNLNAHELLMLCNGHDVMQVTCALIMHSGRNSIKDRVNPIDIERAFRLAYEIAFFRETNLHKALLAWQKSTGYEI